MGTETDLIPCEQPGCRARFFLVPARDFPRLCNDHTEEVRRANGTHHACEEETRRTYRDRREARADRLDGWAEGRAAKAAAASEQASAMAGVIPFGQPILVGHHSEGRDRRYRDRIASTYDRAQEHATKATDMARRADGIRSQLDQSIYSDDPDAIERLAEKLADLEAQRDRIKAYNASCRKGARNLEILDDRQRANLLSVATHCPYQLGKAGEMPAYALSNLGGNIKRTRDRLAQLQGSRP